ncbi:hypothetical protein [Vibrio navarrensis]|uniref:hypothetical protein n=1 Tax=Vibrio navarrensis TaxID=29495 RepID=UPI0018687CAD|nr:hypothetical protein [Vibrio navarrensis]
MDYKTRYFLYGLLFVGVLAAICFFLNKLSDKRAKTLELKLNPRTEHLPKARKVSMGDQMSKDWWKKLGD